MSIVGFTANLKGHLDSGIIKHKQLDKEILHFSPLSIVLQFGDKENYAAGIRMLIIRKVMCSPENSKL